MSENLTHRDAATRSANLKISSYEVELDVRGEETFRTVSTIRFSSRAPETFADFIGDSVEKVVINGREVDVSYDGATIALSGLEHDNTVRIEATGRYSSSGEGLHRFVDPVDSQAYLYTQYEPADARRVFPNFEQPDLKAIFTFTVSAPAAWTVLSNRPEASRRDHGEFVTITFEPTLLMSTYLTAIVAGPYHRLVSEEDDRFALYCRESLKESLDSADIFAVTLSGLELFEKSFDYPYPWGKYDQVFVPEYNLGAMENPGLVTFTEDYLFRGQSTRSQRMSRANTILHEMSHMWFGDLVTPIWWDDLWLKESFAEFMGAWGNANGEMYPEAWVQFVGGRANWAFVVDNYPTTHPIKADIPDLEAADQNFDGITYAKGAAVLRQLVAFVGEEEFFAGARIFFKRHEYSNASLADLLAVLEESSGRDLGEWAEQWLHTSGASTLVYGDGQLTQVGTDPRTGEKIRRPHRLGVGSYELSHGQLVKTGSVTVEVRDTASVSLDGPIIIPNDEAHTYAMIGFDETTTEAILAHPIADPLARASAWMNLWQAVRYGRLSPARYIDAVAHHGSEPDSSLLSAMTTNAAYAVENFMADRQAAREHWFELCLNAYEAALSDGADDRVYVWRRALVGAGATYPSGAQKLHALLTDIGDDKDQRWQVYISLAAVGNVDQDELDKELGQTPTEADILAHMQAGAAIPAHRQAAHDRALTEPMSNDRMSALLAGATANFERINYPFFNMIDDVWRERSQEIATRIVHALFPAGDQAIADGKAWLDGDGANAPAALRKIVIDRVDARERDVRVREG